MPILSPIGRKSPKSRLLIGFIYAVLLTGSLTMLYPLGLMIAGSTKSIADLRGDGSRAALPCFRRSVVAQSISKRYSTNRWIRSISHSTATTPRSGTSRFRPPMAPAPNSCRSGANSSPPAACLRRRSTLGHYWAPQAGAFPSQLRAFRNHLRQAYGTLEALNTALGTDFDAWYTVFIQPPAYLFPHATPDATPLATEFDAFKLSAPDWCQTVLSPGRIFQETLSQTALFERDRRLQRRAWKRACFLRRCSAAPHLPRHSRSTRTEGLDRLHRPAPFRRCGSRTASSTRPRRAGEPGSPSVRRQESEFRSQEKNLSF